MHCHRPRRRGPEALRTGPSRWRPFADRGPRCSLLVARRAHGCAHCSGGDFCGSCRGDPAASQKQQMAGEALFSVRRYHRRDCVCDERLCIWGLDRARRSGRLRYVVSALAGPGLLVSFARRPGLPAAVDHPRRGRYVRHRHDSPGYGCVLCHERPYAP